METHGVSFEGFEPSCGWPSYNNWTEKIIPRGKPDLISVFECETDENADEEEE